MQVTIAPYCGREGCLNSYYSLTATLIGLAVQMNTLLMDSVNMSAPIINWAASITLTNTWIIMTATNIALLIHALPAILPQPWEPLLLESAGALSCCTVRWAVTGPRYCFRAGLQCRERTWRSIPIDHWAVRLEASVAADHWVVRLESSMAANHWTVRLESSVAAGHWAARLESSVAAGHWTVRLVSSVAAGQWAVRLESSVAAGHWTVRMVSSVTAGHWAVRL